MKNYDIFLIFAENIDHGYTLEPPQFCYIKGIKGVLNLMGILTGCNR